MSGFITKIEVEQNAALIIETWGENFYAACLKSEVATFLALLTLHGKI